MSKQQKVILLIGTFVLFLGIGASWFFWWGNKGGSGNQLPSSNTTPTIGAQPTLSEKKKPKIELDIKANRSGGLLTISEIDEDFVQLEYELIYTAENNGQEIERGVSGEPMEIPDSRKISEDLLFGTESCSTGVCHQHIDDNVSGGRVIIRLINGDNQSWSIEKDFVIEETSSGFEAVWTSNE
jgi:hypothetical protein